MNLPAIWRCQLCGECCRHLVGKRFGMAITPLEKRRLEILASRRSVRVHFQPLTSNGYAVTTYQFTDTVCPFLDKQTNRCKIYEWRPLGCKMYPLHPMGISDCTAYRQMQNRGFRIVFPPQLQNSAKQYMISVMPSIRNAFRRFNMNYGRWELNIPFNFKSTI